jgi:hypothetical protein
MFTTGSSVGERGRWGTWQRRRTVLVTVIAAVGLLAIVIFVQGGSNASASLGPTKVEVVTSTGTAVKIVNGGLASVGLPPGPAAQTQMYVSDGPVALNSLNVLNSLPQHKSLLLSSITLTCISCTPDSDSIHSLTATLYDGAATHCGGVVAGGSNTIAVLVASQNQPTVEFTFPSARRVPIDFSASSPWCIGVALASSDFDTGFLTLNWATT